MTLPLEGLRILAVEQYGAGPFGSMYLADLGAEVIKIENLAAGGDVSRATGPYFLGEHDSLFFQTFNRNKRSLTLNLKAAQGQAIFHKLVQSADAVMNNLRGDQPEKLGLDYAHLKKTNPRIVCAHLSAYGRQNGRASWPGYDYLMQAEAGFMSLTGEPDGPPSRFGLSMVDYMTGITTSLALLAAYISARKSGTGRDVDVSLFDVALHQLTYPATWYLNAGHVTERKSRSAHPATVPCQLYKTRDGWVFVMCMIDKFWQCLLDKLDRNDLGEDSRFVDVKARREHRDALTEILDEEFSLQTTDHWLTVFQGAIPIAPVYDLPQAIENPYVHQLGMVQTLAHPQQKDMRVLSNPIQIDGQRLPGKVCSPLGQDTEALLTELGYDEATLAQLKADNIV